MANALHSCETNEHYTPEPIITASRNWLGRIDLDPASCSVANEQIKATTFISKEQDGLTFQWFGTVFLNPPGKGLPSKFWKHLCNEFESGRVTQAVYIGFSIEQLAVLQNSGALFDPLDFPICVPRKRLQFIREDGTIGDRPTHSNVLIGVSSPDKWQSFKEIFSEFGSVKI